MNLQDVPSILSYGFIGFGFLLAFLTFILLIKIISNPHHQKSSVLLALVFMVFAITMAGGGAYTEVFSKNKTETEKELNKKLKELAKEISDLKESLKKMKAMSFNWTYETTKNPHTFQCYVDGKKIGAELDCRELQSCSHVDLNRGMCALRYSGQVFR